MPVVGTAASPGLLHYAGAALRMPGGEAIGMLCVGAPKPGRLGDARRSKLVAEADAVETSDLVISNA